MIDRTIQTKSGNATETSVSTETLQTDNCTPAAEIDRYHRMKWGIGGLLFLLPLLLWLSTLVAVAEEEVVETAVPPTTVPTEPTPDLDIGSDTETGTETETSTDNSNVTMQQVNVYLDDLLLTTPPPPEIVATRIVTETITETLVTVQPITQTVTMTEFIEVTRVIIIPPDPIPGEGEGCTRFDLEMGRNQVDGTPEDGTYILQEPSGHRLATWTAKQGWLDSGWLHNLPLSQDVVHVQVYFYPASGTGPIPLEILNHAPDLPYGWVSNDQCHAVEIQFPE
ncbi:hypothetical protein [Candidatus Leptofilum sp.]|uniref:hypothetical protein n=1 Tax=Candidatus Leptofilum sp. TaxID=3241576 RepID=UPI003B5A9EBE